MQKSKSALFLMELIIVIFFFALTSAVCMQVFVRAHEIAKDTQGTNYAILWADNACECFYEFGNDEEMVRKTLDEAFNLTDYAYALDFKEDDTFSYMTFDFIDNKAKETIYTYTFKRHNKEVSGE